MATHSYNIDVFGGCNLRCPSCPVGNSQEADRPKGMMTPELFTQVLEKVKRETPDVRRVYLYNWTEPALHPDLAGLINIAKDMGIQCSLSTNLNLFRNMDEVVKAGPKTIRVSLSGFSQEIYGRTHAKGDIETVKENMRTLRETLDRHKSKTRIRVLYHCYIDNVGDELDNMERLCKELKFDFETVWAYLMPMEKNFEYFDKGPSEDTQTIVDLLVVKPEESKEIALGVANPDCGLRADETNINCDGSVQLCCMAYDRKYQIADSFLETSHEDLQKSKYAHSVCKKCMSHGLHDSAVYVGIEEWNKIAAERIEPHNVPNTLIPKVRSKGRKVKKKLLNFLNRK